MERTFGNARGQVSQEHRQQQEPFVVDVVSVVAAAGLVSSDAAFSIDLVRKEPTF